MGMELAGNEGPAAGMGVKLGSVKARLELICNNNTLTSAIIIPARLM